MPNIKSEWLPPSTDSELVIGLVAPVGTQADLVIEQLTSRLTIARYKVQVIHIANEIIPLVTSMTNPHQNSLFDAANKKMDAGNKARNETGDNAILALGAASRIFSHRERDEKENSKAAGRVAYILRTLKHPEEVERLREIYTDGFYLLGINADEARRMRYLTETRRMSDDDARRLMERDEDEDLPYGQKVSETFHMADFFVRLDGNIDQLSDSVKRIVDIMMGNPHLTPTFDEFAMFLAFASSLRSADLSRQVGAVLADEMNHEILATGANDCPRAGGGLYWPLNKNGTIEDEERGRDYKRECDPNVRERTELIERICEFATGEGIEAANLKNVLGRSPLREITEFGRVVHAEMEAILACARSGIPMRGSTLFGTTFPCHNCAKHIVAAGIGRVVYVEPYAKSRAAKLHDDSIVLGFNETTGKEGGQKVRFEPFVGIGPRRFFDLFSMRLGLGRRIRRKQPDGALLKWSLEKGCLRRQMLPYSYLELETEAARYFDSFQRSEST